MSHDCIQFVVPCKCDDCEKNRLLAALPSSESMPNSRGPSFRMVFGPTTGMKCTECIRAAPGVPCVFCSGTGIARRADTKYEQE